MTDLHARIDLLEGELPRPLIGAATGLSKRAFAILRLTRSDGTTGLGEASPLPGYSPDSIDDVARDLGPLADGPLHADPLATPAVLLTEAFAAHSVRCPSARFALETALLDWLGQTRAEPLHQIIGGRARRAPIPIADLVVEPNPASWPSHVDALLESGATHLKLKIGLDPDAEIDALRAIRRAHPALPLRLDANRRMTTKALHQHADALEALGLEMLEEPVGPAHWLDVVELPLPFALDETLGDEALAQRLLESGRIDAVVLKPMVLGGLRACLEMAERAAEHGARAVVSHTFDGPIARAAAAELALALQTDLAAGLGAHPALALWPSCEIAAIAGRKLVPHGAPGLGLRLGEALGE
ncbi:MAG TPA: enolase C-terminal domain-like protein [Polyangiales bacterium]|nr:enolase C-terminal domain-like protein [Polyangiales bacterium]